MFVQGGDNAELNAFDTALYNAGVGNYNLTKVSSISPPISLKEENVVGGVAGWILPIAYGSKIEHEKGAQIVAAVIGIIMEFAGCENEDYAVLIEKEMVQEATGNRNIQIKYIKVYIE